MKFDKKSLKKLIAFPILSLTAIMPFTNIASNVGVTKVSSSNQAETSTAVDTDSSSATTKLTLDLNSAVNSQYNAKSFYVQNDMPSISNANGPILLGDNGRSIAAYDWYGNPTWFLNLNSSASKEGSSTSDAQASYYKYSNALSTQIDWSKVGTKVVDVAYLASRDFLYVLTDTSYLFLIQSTTGTINSVKELGNSINKITLIDFNKSLYGWNSNSKDGPVYNIDTQKLTTTVAMESSATGINGKYIFDILPLDVGYNVALLSDTAINSNAKTNITLTAVFVQDNGNKFQKSTGQELTNNIETITLSSTAEKDIYSTTLKRSDSNILIVGNKIYDITLNKSAMENTSFNEISFTQAAEVVIDGQTTTRNINSAFVDSSNLVYFKTDNSNVIYQISLDNKINENMTIVTSGSSYVFNESQAKSARIYPVSSSGNSQVARKGTGYIASPDSFVCTGFTNGSILKQNFNSDLKRPYFSIRNYQNTAPSSFDTTNLQMSNATSYDPYNTEFFADDITGELYIKTKLSVASWYDSSLNATTSSYVIGKWNCAKIENVTKWVSQSQFNQIGGGILYKRSPDQISDQDVTKYATDLLQLPSAVTSSDYKEVNVIVTKRDSGLTNNSTQGKITLKATVKYKNKRGTIVSYLMDDKEYNVKKEANNYKFKFYGGVTDKTDGDSVDISTLGSSFTNFKNTLPSLIEPTTDNLQAFIEIEDKYPTDSRRVITVTDVNDDAGTITLKVHYNNLKVDTPSTFTIKYTGLATKASNKIEFKGDNIASDDVPVYNGNKVYDDENIKDITTIAGYTSYGDKLATDIDTSQINLVYETNLKLMGFNPTITIEKDTTTDSLSSTDAEYGSIKVTLDYTNSKSELLGITLPKEYWNNFGLEEGKISQRYIGFLPIGSTYGISLKSYDSPEVQNVVQNNNVNADISTTALLNTLDVRGYNEEGGDPNIIVQNFVWDGENLQFSVHAQSKKYNTVSTNQTFRISWTPKFAAIRERNLIVASSTSILGVAIVSGLITLYILRRNKIRRFLK